MGGLWEDLLIRFGLVRLAATAALILGAVAVLAYSMPAGDSRERAESYAARASPAAAEIDRAMSRVFSSFDGYLRESRLRNRDFRGIDDIDEVKRRLLPIYGRTNRALVRGRTRISAARAVMLEAGGALSVPPSPALVGDNSPVEAAESTAAEGSELLAGYERYLASYSDFVAYRLRTVNLDRRFVVALSAATPQGPISLSELARTYTDLRSDFGRIRSRFSHLRPHPDARQMHATDSAIIDSYVDYVDDLQQGLRLGDPAVLVRAAAQYFEASQRLSLRARRQLARFANSSSLQSRSRTLTARANELELRIVALGRGLGEPREFQRPKLPEGPSLRGSDGDKRLSSLQL